MLDHCWLDVEKHTARCAGRPFSVLNDLCSSAGAGGYLPQGWWPQAGPNAYNKHLQSPGMMPQYPGAMGGYDGTHMPSPGNGYIPPGMPMPMMPVNGQGGQAWVPSANGGYNCEVLV